ncbi:MAG: DegT/DnrJ/EryC1/StrS family aminotransferase, partial [Deltaproteobacteria bacterium]|nr:DegT/DnrJ/EryC1/StrS family aminotransferase [Deltaproteobacteria bacterium]
MRDSEKPYEPVREEFLVFGSPMIEEPEIKEVVDSIMRGWPGTGPKVAQFEKAFASYKDMPYAAALNSCTAGLHLACLSLGLQPGDEVITTPLTFCATANAIIHAGATPVLADVEPLGGNIDPLQIARKISPRTRAILPVHFAGRPCDMGSIMDLARAHNLAVIEDCAHAIETEYKGRKAGTIGEFGVFSFYVTKNLTTVEGGMVLSRDREKIERIKILGLHGLSRDAWKRFSDSGYKHYYVEEAGFKYNMTDLQAAIGIHQLSRVEANWKRRQELWGRYMDAFAGLPIGLPAQPEPDTRHGYHLFQITIDEALAGISRDRFLDAMTAQQIGVGVHYLSIPEHPYYQRTFGWRP